MSAEPTSRPPRRWLFVVPVAIGIAALALLIGLGEQPQRTPPQEVARAVRVIEVRALDVVPRAIGYGTVQPGKTWEAVAEVTGRVVERNPRLEIGALLARDEVLFRIDPTDYELAVAQAEADIRATQAQLAELDVKAANARSSLDIEDESLASSRRELERKRKLLAQGTISRSQFESQERATLAQAQSVQTQHNTLTLLPSQRRVLEAELARAQAKLRGARLDLERTTIVLPFDTRIAEVNAEQTEFVREGSVIAVADSIDLAEIQAQVPISQMRALIPGATTSR